MVSEIWHSHNLITHSERNTILDFYASKQPPHLSLLLFLAWILPLEISYIFAAVVLSSIKRKVRA